MIFFFLLFQVSRFHMSVTDSSILKTWKEKRRKLCHERFHEKLHQWKGCLTIWRMVRSIKGFKFLEKCSFSISKVSTRSTCLLAKAQVPFRLEKPMCSEITPLRELWSNRRAPASHAESCCRTLAQMVQISSICSDWCGRQNSPSPGGLCYVLWNTEIYIFIIIISNWGITFQVTTSHHKFVYINHVTGLNHQPFGWIFHRQPTSPCDSS